MKHIRKMAALLVIVATMASLATAAAADTRAGTGYEPDQTPDLIWATGYLQYPNPGHLQLVGVHVIKFILQTTGKNAPECFSFDFEESIDPFGSHRYETAWAGEDEAALRWVMDHYCISAAQAQKFGATLLAFFAGIDATRRGIPVAKPPISAAPYSGPVTYTGTGASVVAVSGLPSDYHVVELAHTGASNFIVRPYEGPAPGFSLANEIGTYTGRVVVEDPEAITALEVRADGPWTISFLPPSAATPIAPGGTASGTGDAVLWITSPLPPGLRIANMAFDGSRNFIVRPYGTDGDSLFSLANEIGAWTGGAVLPNHARLIEVTANGGNWFVALS